MLVTRLARCRGGRRGSLSRLALAATLGLSAIGGYGTLVQAETTGSNTNPPNVDPRKTKVKVTVPMVDTKPVTDAQKALAADRAELSKATEQLGLVVGKLKAAWEAKPEVAAAIHAADAARIAYDAAGAPVLANLETRSDYKAAQAAKEAAEKRVDAARSGESTGSDSSAADSNGSGSGDSVATAATDALVARNALTQMRVDALAGDPKAAAAKQTLTAAADKLNAMRAEFDESIKKDPAWVSARKGADDAQAKVNADTAALAAASKKAAADQAAQNAANALQKKYDQEYGAAHAKRY
jgi:hypothetical protein